MIENIEEKIMKVYHVETQGDYDALMIELEEKGCEWRCVEKPTKLDKFKDYGKDTYIYEEYGGIISFSDGYYFKVYRSNETLIEYKAKGESMTQEEMKHNLQEAVESFARGISNTEADLQEAKTSAKKLIEKIDEYFETLKPKFKVGDYVTVYFKDRTIISKIDKLWERTAEVHGLWYDRTKVNVKQDFWYLKKGSKFRYATPTEIAEYESALSFHEHGRKPFEVKDGDLLENKFGRYIANGYSFSKEDFIVGSNTLLKTAEEVNEWLEK